MVVLGQIVAFGQSGCLSIGKGGCLLAKVIVFR